MNFTALLLSPIALAVVLLYSYTKRFTRWSHLVLGFALGIAPTAAWIGIRGSLDPRILLLTVAVTFWVAGFDVLYACQDFEFDQQAGLALHSALLRHWPLALDLPWLSPPHAVGSDCFAVRIFTRKNRDHAAWWW